MPSLIISSIENTGVAMEIEQSVLPRNKLKIYRTMYNLTQEQLADKIGVSRQTVIAIESNKYLPSLSLAFKIVRLFKVKIEDIFLYEGGPNEN